MDRRLCAIYAKKESIKDKRENSAKNLKISAEKRKEVSLKKLKDVLGDFSFGEDFGKRNMPGKRARRHFSQLSKFERDLIIGMKTAGWSTRRVAGQVDRSECAVRNFWEQWTREGTHAWKTGSGATRKTTRREDRRIVRKSCSRLPTSFSDSSMVGRSPDLSPVEHVWDQLKWQMPSCHSVHDLELAVQDLCAHLPQDNIRYLINSMPGLVAACIAAGGGPTRY
ncbi:uncharacterized protein TNCV_3650561 [Trichonephila clavipes]|uniref:Tc3 transposase DNA binding domain-containing protein n=1 Tax=Trichonephila clavipes TaxID=2585209 RepID=A0A8X6VCH9_TRICX|nr:uncharacterized protein TNCV_3650561 [Trichonephila clavipes]